MRKILALLAGAALLLAAPLASANFLSIFSSQQPVVAGATAYFVNSSTGNDANSGTSPASPWKTVTPVNAKVYNAGDSVSFDGGQSFTGPVTLSAASNYSGTTPPSPSQPLTIGSYGTGNATINITTTSTDALHLTNLGNLTVQNLIITGSGASSQKGLRLSNTTTTTQYSNVTFNNIDVSGMSSTGMQVEADGDTSHGFTNLTFNGVNIHSPNAGNTSPGLFIAGFFPYQWTSAVYDHQNVTITNSIVTGAGTDGVDFWNINGGTISNNRIHGNGAVSTGTDANSEIEFQASTNVTFQFNEVDHHAFPTGDSSDGNGINIDRGSSNITAQYNWVHDNAGAGITVFQGSTGIAMSGITVRYNITQNNGTAGSGTNDPCEIILGATGGLAITGLNVYNNTFYSSLGAANVNSIVLFNAANITGTFKNNILQGTANPRSINAGTLNPTTMTFLGNDYFGTTKILWNNVSTTTIGAWGQDASALTSNPTLTSPGTGGTTNGYNPGSLGAYLLQGGSPMFGVGQVIASPGAQDYFGAVIPNGSGTGYNVGADGSAPAAPVVPSAPAINSPTQGATVTTAVAPVSGTGGTTGDTINVILDGVTTTSAATVNSGTWSYNTGSLTNASHTISATETNVTGTSIASTPITFTTAVPAVPPAPIILGPPATPALTTAVATVNGTGATNGDTITVQIDAAACSPACTTTVASNLTWTLNTPPLANGQHAATAIETNGVGPSLVSNNKSFSTNVVVPTTYTLDTNKTTTGIFLSNGALTSSVTSVVSGAAVSLGTLGYSTGKFHFELQLTGTGNTAQGTGIATSAYYNGGASPAAPIGTDLAGNSISLYGNTGNTGVLYKNVKVLSNAGLAVAAGDLIAVEADTGAGFIWFKDVTQGGSWNGTGANPGAGTGGVAFTPGGQTWYVADEPVNAVIAGRSQTVNFGASNFTAQCSTGFVGWNGSSSACPATPPPAGTGTGLVPAASLLPSDLPVTHWHTPAQPWSALNIAPSSYLTRATNLLSWYLANTNSNGSLARAANPYDSTSPTEGTNTNTANDVGIQISLGTTTNQTKGANALTYSTNYYGTGQGSGDFQIGLLAPAISSFSGVLPGSVAGWKSSSNVVISTMPGNSNNWITYDMFGFWAMHQIGQSAFNIGAIESWWTGSCPTNCPNPGDGNNTTNQSQRMSFAPWHLYQDTTGVPDSLSVERVGGANILSLVDDGYNGASLGAMTTDAETAALTDLLMAAADGSGPAGGRQSDHNWVDSGTQLTFDIMANRKHTSNPFLAGQYLHAAEMTFNQMGQYMLPSSACCNGLLFNPTHGHNDPALGIGQQNPPSQGLPTDLFYNGAIEDQTFVAYQYRNQFVVTEQPAPVEIGGYAFALPCGSGAVGNPNWCQAFLAAGGTAVQLATAGATTISNQQYWTALGIERISRVGWTGPLGPGDGYWSVLGSGISFGPTWITSGTTWTRLAQNPSNCHGAFTTTFANPALTLGKVVWTCTGNPAVTFTQNLTVTPDGILSQTTCSGCPSTWGMTFPLMIDNGTLSPNDFGASNYTTAIGTNAAGLVQTSAANGDQQNFMTLSANGSTLVNEVTENNSYGHISSIRAWTGTGSTSDATQTTFIYPRKSSDPSATTVRAAMTVTGTNTYSNTALGNVFSDATNGTYYVGPTAAGGWAQTVNIGGQNTTFTLGGVATPCNFILTVSGGKVSSIEADRNILVTIPNGVNSSHTNLSLTAFVRQTGL